MAPDLRTLSKQERFCLDSLENAVEFMNDYEEENDKGQIAGWLERLESIFANFMQIRLQLDILEDDEEETETTEKDPNASRRARNKFEKQYIEVKAFLQEAAAKANPATESTLARSGSSRPDPFVSRIKLPEVKLPTFDGSISEWLTFRDTFRSLIDSNPNLSNVDKFSYLVASLTTEAKHMVESIDITSANYDVAWATLSKRYDNKKLVVKSYLDALTAIEPIKRESYESLARLIDDFERNLQMIDKMKVETKGWSVLLAHMVCSRLDSSTLKQWENHHKSTEVPEYENLMAFLRNYCTILQSVAPAKQRTSEVPRSEPNRTTKSNKVSGIHAVVSSTGRKCTFCSQSFHSPFKCETFRKLSVSQRYDEVKKKHLCINCLSADHQILNCSSGACRICGKKHHTMLHQQAPLRNSNYSKPSTNVSTTNQTQSQSQVAPQTQPVADKPSSQAPSTEKQPPSNSSSLIHCSTSLVAAVCRVPSTVLLQTALVKMFSSNGSVTWARALLDPASQLNLVTENLVQRLQIRKTKDHHTIGGIGKSTIISNHSIVARIDSHCSSFSAHLKFFILKSLTRELPTNSVIVSDWNWPNDIVLADPKFNEPAHIDMIIGMETYYDLLLDGLIRLGPGKPVLQNTQLGWVVSGKVGTSSSKESVVNVAHVCDTQKLEEQIAKFWELEACHSSSTLSVEESNCEAHFAATTTRDASGRFVVVLPKRASVVPLLGDSYEIAKRRFLSLERRLQANPELHTAYAAFIEEYHRLGHMRLVEDEPNQTAYRPYYLPHHCIVRPESLTTKLRVVFDASCATDTGISLNDMLMVGPIVQGDLFSLILRLRLHRFALIADVEKMYRQILVHPADQVLQRILWRNSPSEPLQIFELSTVTYGTSSAPYLATKCLQELSHIGQTQYPDAAEIVGRDFYMDDLISGVSDVEQGKVISSQLIHLLGSVGFPLRKWSSNSPEILEHIATDLRDERTVLGLDPGATVKTLGLRWEPATDLFSFRAPKWKEDGPITKRQAVSDTSSLFDPPGFIGPAIVVAKMFVQELWRNKKSWDEPLEEPLQERWLQFRSQLAAIEDIKVPRWVIPIQSPTHIELHGFCDASERAYGACIYLRAVSADGECSVHLLTSKSKLVSLANAKTQKKTCLARLELCGALLLSHLFQKVKDALKIPLKCFFWTDSMIVLHWISAAPARWKMFIANRVSEIQHLTAEGIWAHVPGLENPADIISRGMLPADLKECALWWNGPSWLSKQNRFWPPLVRPTEGDFSEEELEQKVVVLPVQIQEPSPIFSLRSSYYCLVRLVAYLLRFAHNCKSQNQIERRTGFLKTAELDGAIKVLVRMAQQESFPGDIQSVATGGQVKQNSQLKSLNPILEDGILKAGGRLTHAPIPESRKHPMILAPNHPLTVMVAEYYHKKLLHAGPQLLISSLRGKFWPLRVRNLARKVVHSCIRCYRCKPTVQQQLMGSLPGERVTPTLAFLTTGVDLCGPLYYRHPGRKSPPVKCYVAIFVCLVTKAMHIELVADLSTNSFISALKRFVARRSAPKIIECDNATNFRGASRELAQLREQFKSQQHQQEVISHCAEEGIQFKFIPPRSPNFGGLWEAAVKSFKKHLKATIGLATLYKDDLQTLLTQIEGCLNSRPLTQLTADPEDLEVLTPGHFLVHRPLVGIAEPSYEALPQNRLDRYQQTQEYLRRIWKRWSTDYLSGLLPRTKWTAQRDNIAIGTMVLVKEDNMPPLKWRLGRVVQIIRGDDGNVRVVSVKTKDGEYKRAISNICVLPIQQPAAAEDAVLSNM